MEDEEYRDGDLDYSVIEASIEEIIDKYEVRAFLYIESDSYDNVLSTTMIREYEDEECCEAVQFEALVNLVADILKDHIGDERNALIAEIYERVNQGIHIDDEEDEEGEEFE